MLSQTVVRSSLQQAIFRLKSSDARFSAVVTKATHLIWFSNGRTLANTNPSTMSSPLVQGFTPAEREALSKFKSEYLQRALEEASSEALSPSTHEIWNVPIIEDDVRVDVIIVKFLRAK